MAMDHETGGELGLLPLQPKSDKSDFGHS